MSVKIRREIGFDSGNETSVQIRFNRKIRTILGIFIPISMGISQSKSGIAADGDKLGYINYDRQSIVFKILVNSSIIGAPKLADELGFVILQLIEQILACLINVDIGHSENIAKDPNWL